jgi:hypothetical protein
MAGEAIVIQQAARLKAIATFLMSGFQTLPVTKESNVLYIKKIIALIVVTVTAACLLSYNAKAGSKEMTPEQEYVQNFKDSKKMVGKQYWMANGYTFLYDKPDENSKYSDPKGAISDYYGPFKILSVVGTEKEFFLKILTPQKTVKYMPNPLRLDITDYDPTPPKPKRNKNCDENGIALGMTNQQVLASCLGKPRGINTTYTSNRKSEQWIYGGGYVYLENGVVTSIQTSR